MEILPQTPNLEVLSAFIPYNYSVVQSAPLTMKCLHTLELHHDHGGVLLALLTLPVLKTLELVGLESAGVPRLLALGVRSAWSLRSTHVVGMVSKVSNRCLRATPSVEEVEIRHFADEGPAETLDDLVHLLHHDGTFLPALRVLVLRNCPMAISASSLAAMLASRWNGHPEGVAKLRSFHLFFEHGAISTSVDELRSHLRPLMSAGLDIVVGFSPNK